MLQCEPIFENQLHNSQSIRILIQTNNRILILSSQSKSNLFLRNLHCNNSNKKVQVEEVHKAKDLGIGEGKECSNLRGIMEADDSVTDFHSTPRMYLNKILDRTNAHNLTHCFSKSHMFVLCIRYRNLRAQRETEAGKVENKVFRTRLIHFE